MKTHIVWLVSLCTAGLLAVGCGAGSSGVKDDGLHGSSAPDPATDINDTANYRIRNERQDAERGDTLKQTLEDTAQINVDQKYP